MEQGTDEWFNARCGMVTASRLTDVLGTKGKRRKYAEQLARESIQGFRVVTEPNEYMIWGTETEPEARSAYEARSGSLVDLVGFVIHPAIKRSGARAGRSLIWWGSLSTRQSNAPERVLTGWLGRMGWLRSNARRLRRTSQR